MPVAVECMAGGDGAGFMKFQNNVLVPGNRTELL